MSDDRLSVTVNGEPRRVVRGTTVAALVEELSYRSAGIAVAVDREVVPRSTWGETVVRDGTRVEVVTAVSGG
ncbi:MAG TPA: sulfur carrier protein ThiS [Acidimicrobiales bacterium]|nr:sulfur carrier protein ThiS [Acidimicrobiales bacterium]